MTSEEWVDIDHLIRLVEQNPLLWSKEHDRTKNKPLIASTWRQICCQLNQHFDTLHRKEQDAFIRLVSKKWTNIKDSFHKARKRSQEQRTHGRGLGKRGKYMKRYIYAHKLEFLKANCVQEPTTENTHTQHHDYGDNTTTFNAVKENSRTPKKLKRPLDIDTQLNTTTTTILPSHTPLTPVTPENPHLSFFKGIIPSLEKLDEEQILEFQIGVLNVLQNVRKGRPIFEAPYTHSHHFLSNSPHMLPSKPEPIGNTDESMDNVDKMSPCVSTSDLSENQEL